MATNALAMEFTKASVPRNPIRGCAFASEIRCSAPPNPISSRTLSTSLANSLRRSGGAGFAEVKSELRQQCIEKGRLPRLEWVTLAAAEERARWLFFAITVLLQSGVSR